MKEALFLKKWVKWFGLFYKLVTVLLLLFVILELFLTFIQLMLPILPNKPQDWH